MKKKILSAAIVMGMIATLFTGCGDNGGTKEVVITTDELLSHYDFDIAEQVKLCDYKDITINLEDTYEISEESLIEYTNMYLVYSPEYTTSEKTVVEDKDIVNINYVGMIDGEIFDNGSANDQNIEIGLNLYIDGFEEGLIGHSVGETFTEELKFPADYEETKYASKDVKFEITINSIQDKTIYTYDTLTDEYAATLDDVSTAKEYIDNLKTEMQSSADTQKEADVQTILLEKLLSESKITIPEEYMDKYFAQVLTQVNTYAQNLNFTFEEYVQTYEGFKTTEEFEENLKMTLQDEVKQQFILDAIIQKESRTITEKGFKDFVNYYLGLYDMTEEEFYTQYGSEESIKLIYAENLLLADLIDSVIVNVGVVNGTADKLEKPIIDDTSFVYDDNAEKVEATVENTDELTETE